ncbi:MAG: FimV family protein [Betaproteobacteria bacterium]|nr:FimV family protein [Betaproteobacteria bacterium]
MRLKPVISYGLLAGVLALPAPVLAVALGKLVVSSGLGQPLVATVEIVSASKEELESLAAKIADPAAYRQNGLEYQAALGRVKVAVDRSKEGRAVVKLSSTQAINEPFVDLLLEVNWAAGRLLREYTFLLDPPGYNPTPAAVAAAAPVAAPAAAPRGLTVEAPATTTAPATVAAPIEGTPAPESAAEGNQYGPTKKGDTLGKIARQVKPEGVTLEQMLVALFQSNQGAFDGKNMNRLRTGQAINVPGADQVAAIASNDATKLVRIQAADWRSYRDRVAGAPSSSQSEGMGQAASGRITTAVVDTAVAAPAGDQLRVSRADGAAGGKTGKGKGKAAAAAVAEDAAAGERALREANARVTDLEKTVKDLQKLVDLKNKELSELQQVAQAAKAAPKPEPVAAPVPAPTQVAVAPVAPKAVEAPKPEIKPEPPKAEPPKVEATPAEPPKAAETPKAEDAPKVAPPKPAQPAKAVAKAPVQPVEEPAWYEDLFADPMMVLGGGAAIAALGGVWAVLAARRRRPATSYEDSILTGTDIKTNTVFGNTGGGVVNTGDNSLTTGFSRQGLGNIDTDEVDPIAEAEVYLAYGRDAQAEEILRDALQKDPNRQEVYLKLLEIQAQHNKVTAFETLAQEFYGVSKGQGEAWEKAAALGRQLDPKNALYAAAEGVSEPATEAPIIPDEADTLVPAQPLGAAVMPELRFAPERTQTFTVPPALAPEEIPAPSAKSTSIKEFESLDFSLDDLAPRTVAPTQPPTTTSRPSLDDTVKLDDLDWDEPSFKSAPVAAVEPKLPEIRIAEPELAMAGGAPAPAAAPAPVPAVAARASAPAAAAQTTAGLDLDKLDLSFDPDRIPFEDPTPSVLDGQWHDAATKLDLAKAYQEMGDIEGSREILREVLHEGDEGQKKEAQAMLDRLH